MELWQEPKTQHSAIRICQLVHPKIYVGTELLWLQGKTISGKKRSVVLGINNNKDLYHATLINENETTYLAVETDEPISLDKYYNDFVVDLFEKIIGELIEGEAGVILKD